MDRINMNKFSDLANRCDSTGSSELSPMTNLAINLSGLSTSIAGTPIRRISWSNPLPGGDKIGLNLSDLSPSTDSPTFQDIFKTRKLPRPRTRKIIQNIFESESDEKENLTPPCPKASIHFSPEEDSDCGIFPSNSQDSGYSTGSIKKVRSSIFTYDEDDSMETIFQLEDSEDGELSAIPDNMLNLLTKPLASNNRLSFGRVRKGKPPIRRCLSMEMEYASGCSTISSSSSENEMKLASIRQEPDEELDTRKNIFKRPNTPTDFCPNNKRRKSAASIEEPSLRNSDEPHVFKRSYSETAATIMHALHKADLQPELVGDGSRSYALPLVHGRHQDLKCISSSTLASLMNGHFRNCLEKYILVDCRYPYEFEGGHIKGALNIFTKEDIMEIFFKDTTITTEKTAIVFHCEFSSERAPNLCRFLRNTDREINEGNYPRLNHPEVYILEGGYKSFFESNKDLCEPQGYKPMNHKDHGFDLRHFRAKSKSWGAEQKSRTKLRSNSKPMNF